MTDNAEIQHTVSKSELIERLEVELPVTKGDYSSAQHSKIMQLQSRIQSLVTVWENSSDTTKDAIRQDGAFLYTLLEMKNTLKHKDYDGDYP